MPSFETVDRLEIDAPAQVLFDTIPDYPRMRDWYHRYEVDVIGGGDVLGGAQLQHVLAADAIGRALRPLLLERLTAG